MNVRIHGVTTQMNRFRYLSVRDHAGRTTAETRRQLELNSAAQVASATMVNEWHRWTVKTLKGIWAMSKYAQQLVSSVPPQETVKHWTQARWTESWESTTTILYKSMPTPTNCRHGVGLSRRAWTRLNMLWTGVNRFGATMLR